MPLTLTKWWEKLDEETRKLAAKYEDVSYPTAMTAPYTDVTVDTDMTYWQVVHKMASLGAAIEANVMSGQTIADKIAAAGKKLGEPVPSSPRYIPIITDEKSLLFAVIYYRSQYRFQDIQSSKSLVQNGAFGIPGIQQNKPAVAQEAEILRAKIKDYCSINKNIAASAQLKFDEIFPHEAEVGRDLFKPKSFSEQHKDFASKLMGTFLEDIKENEPTKFYSGILNKTKKIINTLENTEKQFETLYFYKKLKEFIASEVQEYSDATFERFKNSLPPECKENPEAQTIWEAAELFIKEKKAGVEKVTEGVNYYMPAFLQTIVHFRFNPLAHIPRVLGLDENTRFKRFKEDLDSYARSKIDILSKTLSQETKINEDDIKTASSQDILKSTYMSQELCLEIEALKTSIQAYAEELRKNKLIKFSTAAPFIGWFTKQLAKLPWTKNLLHDNILYLELAENSAEKLETIKGMKSDENANEALSRLKGSMRQSIREVKDNSRYLLFKEERELAHKRFSNIADAKKNEDEDSTGLTPM